MKKLIFTLLCTFLMGNILNAQNDLSFASISFEKQQNLVAEGEISQEFAYVPVEEPKIQEIIQDIKSRVVYPSIAEEYGIEGSVKLELLYDGNIQNIHVVASSSDLLETAAIEAIQKFVLSRSQTTETKSIIDPVKIPVLFRFTL